MKSHRLRGARTSYTRTGFSEFVGKDRENRPLGRLRQNCEDSIEINLNEVGYNNDADKCVDVAQGRSEWRRFVNAVLTFEFITP